MKKFHFGILKIRPLNIADLLCYEKMCSPPLFFAWVPPRLCLGGTQAAPPKLWKRDLGNKVLLQRVELQNRKFEVF